MVRGCLIITNNCNLNCEYCFQRGCKRNNNILSVDDASNFIDMLLKINGAENVGIDILGGEPFLFPTAFANIIESTYDKINSTGNGLVVYTNGTIYNKTIIASLKKVNNVELRIVNDPDEKAIFRTNHNKVSYFELINENVEKFRNDGFNVKKSLTVFSKGMIPFYSNFIDNIIKNKENFVTFAYVTNKEEDFDYDDIYELCEVFYEKCNEYGIQYGTNEWNSLSEKCGLQLLHSGVLLSENLKNQNNDCSFGCLPYITEMAISPLGYVIPCAKAVSIEEEYSDMHISIAMENIKQKKEFIQSNKKIKNNKCNSCLNNAFCNVCDILPKSNGKMLSGNEKCERASIMISAQLDYKIKIMKEESLKISDSISNIFNSVYKVFDAYQ